MRTTSSPGGTGGAAASAAPVRPRGRVRRRTVGAAALLLLAACAKPKPAPAPVAPTPTPAPVELATPRQRSAFALGGYRPLDLKPILPDYRLKPDLSQVVNLKDAADLSAADKARLAAIGFCATALDAPRLDQLYRAAGEGGRPTIITADTALAAFSRVIEDTRRRLAADSYPALLSALTLTLLQRSQEQFATVTGSELREAARRNSAYFGVAAGLLGINLELEGGAAKLVAAERKLIDAHAEPAVGAILPYRIDYRRFASATGEVADERLARQRLALTWYATAPLALTLQGEEGEPAADWRVTRQVLLLSQALAAAPESPLQQWEALSDSQRWFAGGAAELDLGQVLATAAAVYGPTRQLRDYEDFDRLKQFAARLTAAVPAALLPPMRQTGWPGPAQVRLLGSAALLDAEVLGELAAPLRREAASGLELFAVLGLPRAVSLVSSRYRPAAVTTDYQRTVDRLATQLTKLGPEGWQRDLHRGRIWAAAPLGEPHGKGWPAFQRTAAWSDRTLQTVLANWAELRHEPALGPPGAQTIRPDAKPPVKPAVTYVEPAPEVYARLKFLSDCTLAGLETHGLATEPVRLAHRALAEWLARLTLASVKELRNQSLSAAEKQKLATYAGDLRWWLSGLDAGQPDDQQRTARLADLGLTTDGRRQVVGVGPVLRLRVIVPDDGKFYLADGAAWSYAERLAPAREPQSDAAWQAAWLGQEPPGLPEWTSTFTSAGATALPVGAKAGRP